MTDRPLPDDLISGYLDNQLPAEERRVFEALLRESPSARRLLSALERQSGEVSQLPGYRLDTGFADRVMADPRTGVGFDRIDAATPTAANLNSLNRRSAVAAIVSLAALILVAVFLQQPRVANRKNELSQLDASRLPDEAKPAGVEMQTRREFGETRNSETAALDIVGQGKGGLERAMPRAGFGGGRLPAKEDLPSVEKLQMGQKPAERELGSRIVGQAAAAQPAKDVRESEDLFHPGDKLASRAKEAFQPSGDGSPDPESASGQAQAAGGIGSARAREWRGRSHGDPTASPLPLAYSHVIEIAFPNGPQGTARFMSALKRNNIALQTEPQGGNTAQSRMYIVTAPPGQMTALIADLSDQAKIAGYRLPSEPNSLEWNDRLGFALPLAASDRAAEVRESRTDLGRKALAARLPSNTLADSSPANRPQPSAAIPARPGWDGSNRVGKPPSAGTESLKRFGFARELEGVLEFDGMRGQVPGADAGVQPPGEEGTRAGNARFNLTASDRDSLESYLARPAQPSPYRRFLVLIHAQPPTSDGEGSPTLDNEPLEGDPP